MINLKNSFETLTLAGLEDWKRSQRQEDLHLDFKLLISAPEFKRDDRKNLAKAISAFSNSDGGLVVWGVDCRKNVDGVNCVSELLPLSNASAAISTLQTLTGEATVPIVAGVEHRVIPLHRDDGFVVTHIPSSEVGPHMAMMGENRYYKRSGDSFYQMEHFDISDMFGRRTHPLLRLCLMPGTGGASSSAQGRSAQVQAIVGIQNSGRGIARFPLLKIRPSRPYRVSDYELDGNGRAGLPVLVGGSREVDWHSYAGGVDNVVHPGTLLDVTLIRLDVSESAGAIPDMVIDYLLASEGVQPTSGVATIPGTELLELARNQMERSFPPHVKVVTA